MDIIRKYLLSSVARAPDDGAAPGGGDTSTAPAIVERSAGGDGPLSLRDAANALTDARRKDNAQAREAQGDTTATEQQESPSQEDGTAQETGPGETQGDDQQAEKPAPIDPPRSWTKEDKELFKGLPRETQERLVDRERSRESDFLKRQNDATEKLKGLTTQQQEVEKARAQYEQALPMLLQQVQDAHAGEFADVKSIADVERLAREDWPRYVLWDAQQKKVAAIRQEVQTTQSRQSQEKAQKWQTFAQEQDALLLEKAPELAEKGAMSKAGEGAVELLKGLGFTDGELGKLWNGQAELSLRDHRVQLLIRDGMKYRDAQAAAKKAAAAGKTVPSVQRPGTPTPRGADADARVKALDTRLNQTGSLRDAAALLVAKRTATR